MTVVTATLSDSDKKQLLQLWNAEYPENLSYSTLQDFNTYLTALENPLHFLLLNKEKVIMGWAFSFDREATKWFGILLAEKCQGKGFGKQLLTELKKTTRELNGWVIDHDHDLKANGSIYYSPLPFYIKSGFVPQVSERLELDKISAVKIKWKDTTF
jgi:GNAT superfamily N-acetyltransferase